MAKSRRNNASRRNKTRRKLNPFLKKFRKEKSRKMWNIMKGGTGDDAKSSSTETDDLKREMAKIVPPPKRKDKTRSKIRPRDMTPEELESNPWADR
jgi:hypothetical protein